MTEYKVSTAGSLYNLENEKEKYIQFLKKLGFRFIPATGFFEGMHNIEPNEIIMQISNLQELQEFIKNVGRIVLDEDSIIIYDDYME